MGSVSNDSEQIGKPGFDYAVDALQSELKEVMQHTNPSAKKARSDLRRALAVLKSTKGLTKIEAVCAIKIGRTDSVVLESLERRGANEG